MGQSSKSRKTYLKVVQNVQLSGRSPRTNSMDDLAISFTDEDAERIHHPHDDAIVITLLIADYTTRRVLVDNGSSADILYYPAFQQMRLGRDRLRPVCSPLIGFGGMKVQPVGTITLPVVVGSYPQQVTREVNFLVVDCFIFVQCHYRKTNPEQLEGNNVYLPSISQIPNGVWDRPSTRRSVGS